MKNIQFSVIQGKYFLRMSQEKSDFYCFHVVQNKEGEKSIKILPQNFDEVS